MLAKQKFFIDNKNFGVGKIVYSIDRKKSVLEELIIYGNDEILTKHIDKEDEEDPLFFISELPFITIAGLPFSKEGNKIKQKITLETNDEIEAILYIMYHTRFQGELTIDENDYFTFIGTVNISGKEKKLEIATRLKNEL